MGHFTTKHAWWPTRCSDDRLEPKNGFLVKFWVNNPCMRMHTNVFLWSKCALGSKKTTILGTFWFGLKSKQCNGQHWNGLFCRLFFGVAISAGKTNVFPKTSHQKDVFLLQLLHSGRLSVTWFLTKTFRSRQFWILAPFSLHGKCLVPGSTRYYLMCGTSPCSDFGTFKTAFFVENSIWKPHFVRCFRPKIARRSHFRAPNNCISTSKGNRRSVTLFWFETEPKWRMKCHFFFVSVTRHALGCANGDFAWHADARTGRGV